MSGRFALQDVTAAFKPEAEQIPARIAPKWCEDPAILSLARYGQVGRFGRVAVLRVLEVYYYFKRCKLILYLRFFKCFYF